MRHSYLQRRQRRQNAQINITPLVDVMLVLLIVFMIAAPLLSVGVPLELPNTNATSLPTPPQEPLTISIDKNTKLYIQDTQIELSELAQKLQSILGENNQASIYVRGDKSVNYGAILKLMAEINAAGFTNVSLVSLPEK